MPPHREQCGALAAELGRHARLLHLLKSRLAGWAPEGLDGAAFGLLMLLVKAGPQRQGELAEASLLDPSTVSRYVSQLVKADLVQRRADPVDGRAVQLAATESGAAVGAEAAARREQLIGEMLDGWPADDVETLVRLLSRLNQGMEAHCDLGAVPPIPATSSHAASGHAATVLP